MKIIVLLSVYFGFGPLFECSGAHALVEIDGFTEDFLSKLDELEQDVLFPGEGMLILLNECTNATGMSKTDATKLGALFRTLNKTEEVHELVFSMRNLLGALVSNSFRDCMAESINDLLEKCAKLVCMTSSEEDDLKGGFHNYLWSLALKRPRFLENVKKLGPERGFNFVMCGVDPLVRTSDDT